MTKYLQKPEGVIEVSVLLIYASLLFVFILLLTLINVVVIVSGIVQLLLSLITAIGVRH